MKVGSKIIVSDAGEYGLKNVNAALTALGAKRIDVAIMSHPHEDHVKNFIDLFAQWQVKKAVMSRSAYWQGTQTNRAVTRPRFAVLTVGAMWITSFAGSDVRRFDVQP